MPDDLLRTHSGRLQRARDAYRAELEPPLTRTQLWMCAGAVAALTAAALGILLWLASLAVHL